MVRKKKTDLGIKPIFSSKQDDLFEKPYEQEIVLVSNLEFSVLS